MSQPILEIKNITKTFQKEEVLSPFSLQLDEGQICVLVGGNGAGKSTIIKMIGGIFQPTGGEISVCGLGVQDRKNYPNKIGYMPDDFQFPNGLTVKEWLSFHAKLCRVPKQQTEKALQLVGLSKKQNETVAHLSKGMRQRLLFAQAYIRNASLLLLDEPTNGLDPYWVSTFADILLQLRSEKRTILLSTHQLDVAATIADIIIFLHQGKIYHEIEVTDVDRDQLHTRLFQINKEIYGFK
ncbi:ABC transporter ATP-binding protein [Bacillus sp. 1NLA3E]|jgi:ABC-type multidrug transport system ATPase subunit|uniref:ABC transporter ATP-binding protein n=1 Tax=Bacillus sp. 1NLA3E TaxID=666686 RepID=UPI000247EF85|nr:ABC transporter ATP-binding protein [Bacillus sp. 1NLA3E]AGK56126.1 multidrug ABC transporter ATPase [Bacillus sp. 1NLA3E]